MIGKVHLSLSPVPFCYCQRGNYPLSIRFYTNLPRLFVVGKLFFLFFFFCFRLTKSAININRKGEEWENVLIRTIGLDLIHRIEGKIVVAFFSRRIYLQEETRLVSF